MTRWMLWGCGVCLGCVGLAAIAAAAPFPRPQETRVAAEPDPVKAPTAEAEPARSTVGIPARILQLVLPGSLLEAAPWDDPQAPLTLRILRTYRHGDAWRYDLEYCGLAAGDYDLCSYLRRIDGTPSADLPSIPVHIAAVLPADRRLPHPLQPAPPPRVGGYRGWLVLGILAWMLGLLGIWRLRRSDSQIDQRAPQPRTLADRLRPLVADAIEGKLPREQQAELERLLLNFWRRKLNLQALPHQESFARLREHSQAGPLLRQLEHWLHHPAAPEPVDLNVLLEPYRNVSLDDAELLDDAAAGPAPHPTTSQKAGQ